MDAECMGLQATVTHTYPPTAKIKRTLKYADKPLTISEIGEIGDIVMALPALKAKLDSLEDGEYVFRDPNSDTLRYRYNHNRRIESIFRWTEIHIHD